MRFVSKFQRYSLCIKPEKSYRTADGTLVVQDDAVICDWQMGGLTAWEAREALEHFQFKGLPDGLEPSYRLSVLDTSWQGWDDETREWAEAELLRRQGYDFIVIETPRAPTPWPTYDRYRGGGRGITTAKAIAEKVKEDGFEPDAVILYERENQNRADVIEALQALLVEAPDELEVVA